MYHSIGELLRGIRGLTTVVVDYREVEPTVWNLIANVVGQLEGLDIAQASFWNCDDEISMRFAWALGNASQLRRLICGNTLQVRDVPDGETTTVAVEVVDAIERMHHLEYLEIHIPRTPRLFTAWGGRRPVASHVSLALGRTSHLSECNWNWFFSAAAPIETFSIRGYINNQLILSIPSFGFRDPDTKRKVSLFPSDTTDYGEYKDIFMNIVNLSRMLNRVYIIIERSNKSSILNDLTRIEQSISPHYDSPSCDRMKNETEFP